MRSKFLNKFAYGLDNSGEVQDNHDEVNIEEGSEPWKAHRTPDNPANMTRDGEAEAEFPEIVPKSNRIPPRNLK